MGLHVFVAMPFGRKQDLDFDAVYADYLRPALSGAGFEVFRADLENRAGDTGADLFQALLLADLIVVDQSLDTANAGFELDVLRALRARGIVLVHSAGITRTDPPSGDTSDPRLRYHVKDGRPDPNHLQADRHALASTALATVNSISVPAEQASDRADAWQPRQVALFSGHMIDAPDRSEPRFPAECEPVAAKAIAARLDDLGMGGLGSKGDQDLAICGGACGGDLLFAEAALQRGCRLHLYLQYNEADFLQASVAFAGESWVDRYYAVKGHAATRIRVQSDELGPLPKDINPYVRNNLWQLYSALAYGVDKVRFIALWNGEGGSGAGGTQNMVETVTRYAGRVSILDTRQLFGL